MKYHKCSVLFVCIISTILLLSGCSDILEGEGQVQINLVLDDHGFSDSTIFSIEGLREGTSSKITKSINSGLASTNLNVEPGTWTFTVFALNAGGIQEGQGTATCTVQSGTLASISIDIVYDYVVTFDLNYEGSPQAPGSIDVAYDSPYGVLPVELERTGYTFAGWYDHPSNDTKLITTDSVFLEKKGQTLYACWAANTYKVSFDLAYDDSPLAPDSINVKYESVYGSLPSVEDPMGYTFNGWYDALGETSAKITETSIVSVAADRTLYAHWTENTYRVTFVNEDGTTELETKMVAYGTTPSYTGEGPTKEATAEHSYAFSGWSPEIVAVTGAVTYKAMYDASINNYEVIFVDHDGAQIGETQTVAYGSAATAPTDPTWEGHTFAAWDVAFTNITADTTVKATYAINSYRVTFVNHTGTQIGEAQTVAYGSAATAPGVLERSGYVFSKWDNDFENITKDLTVKATYDSLFIFDSETKTIKGFTTVGRKHFNGNVVIPSKIDEIDVLIIGENAFYEKSLTSVIISEGITNIEASAFRACQLTLVEMPNTIISIGEQAFRNNEFETIQLSSSLETIGSSAFTFCKLTSIEIPDSVKVLESSVFSNNQLASVKLPDSVEKINSSAFHQNKLTVLDIPNTATVIDQYAFSYNGLDKDIMFGPTNPGTWMVVEMKKWIQINPSNFEFDKNSGTITKYIGNRQIEVIPNKIDGIAVEKIGNYSFENKNMTTVVIPDSVKSIGYGAFQDNQLTSVTIPDSVTEIQSSAFLNNRLESIHIPDSVTKIGTCAFNNNLLPDEQAFIYGRKWSDGTEDKTILIGYGGAKKTNIEIPFGVETIGYIAFYFNDLETVVISNSVKTIGIQAFDRTNLKSVSIPDSVTEIGAYAFSNNTIEVLNIPLSVKILGKAAFNNNQLPDDKAFIYRRNFDCTIDITRLISYGGFKKNAVQIPATVKKIDESAFESTDLKSVTIPSSVTSISSDAFLNNGPDKNSNSIPDTAYIGTWQVVDGIWIKQ